MSAIRVQGQVFALLRFRSHELRQKLRGLGAMVTVVAIFGAIAHGHEDPRGDVQPSIITASGRFEVYFTSNLNPAQPVYRTIFSAEGKLIANRELFDGKVPMRESFSSPFMEEGVRPSYAFYPAGERRAKICELKMPPGTYTDCSGIGWLSDTRIVTRDSRIEDRKSRKWPFSVRVIDLTSGEVLHSATIGLPARGGNLLARTSSSLSAGSSIIFAWMEEKPFSPEDAEAQQSAYRVVVTRWQPKLGRTEHLEAAPAINDNVKIEIGRIKNVVLVAWHEMGGIRYRTVNLESAPFVKRLPELRLDAESERKVWKEIKVGAR